MQRRTDRHNWLEEWGDLISDLAYPEQAPDFPWSGTASEAFYRLAYNQEDNDCGVRALAVACAAPYEQAHWALQEQGRVAGHGCHVSQMIAAAPMLHCHMVRTTCTARTMRGVERELEHTHGGFIVTTADHAAGLWNGELIDHQRGTLKRLDGIFRVEQLRNTAP